MNCSLNINPATEGSYDDNVCVLKTVMWLACGSRPWFTLIFTPNKIVCSLYKFLKTFFFPETMTILSIHTVGSYATELIVKPTFSKQNNLNLSPLLNLYERSLYCKWQPLWVSLKESQQIRGYLPWFCIYAKTLYICTYYLTTLYILSNYVSTSLQDWIIWL